MKRERGNEKITDVIPGDLQSMLLDALRRKMDSQLLSLLVNHKLEIQKAMQRQASRRPPSGESTLAIEEQNRVVAALAAFGDAAKMIRSNEGRFEVPPDAPPEKRPLPRGVKKEQVKAAAERGKTMPARQNPFDTAINELDEESRKLLITYLDRS